MIRSSLTRAVRHASTLVFAESADGALAPSALHAVTAASQIGGDVDVLVVAEGGTTGTAPPAEAAAAASRVAGVRRVLTVPVAPTSPEPLSRTVAGLVSEHGYTHVVAASTSGSKSVIPRAAGLAGVSPIADVSAVSGEGTFERPVYAGNAVETVESSDPVRFVTARVTSFDPAPADSGSEAPVEEAAAAGGPGSSFVSAEIRKSDKPQLAGARVVVAGGRGLKNGENFSILEDLADQLEGAVGASRAAVDAGWVPNDLQVGQTGKIVAPELYIAAGISGAIQHLAGMKDSKVIAAINKDPEAPIFQVADYGLVADLFDAVPELTNAVKK